MQTCQPRPGALRPHTSTHRTSTVLRSPGNICAAIPATARPGNVADCGNGKLQCIAGACDVACDPRLDARDADPLWLTDSADLLHVRALHARHASSREPAARAFDLWRVPGRKRLDVSSDAVLTTSIGTRHARILLDGSLTDGSTYTCAVPLTPHLRGQIAEFQALSSLLDGDPLPRLHARPVSRAGLLHLRALQALDATQAGASHRDLAMALYGPEAVRAEWHADGVLRAQVRHLVARAEGFMQRDYLALAGVRHAYAGAPGDEPMR